MHDCPEVNPADGGIQGNSSPFKGEVRRGMGYLVGKYHLEFGI